MEYDKDKIIEKFNEIRNKHGFSLFCCSKLFNKNIAIVDMEMTGNRYVPEIIEFFGIKINNGNLIDVLYFECKPKRKIAKKVIKMTDKDNNYYLDKKPIEEYQELLIPFLKDSILCCYDWSYDCKTLMEEYKWKFKSSFEITSKIIDAAYLLRQFLNKNQNIGLYKYGDKNKFLKHHNAIDDVFKLIDILYDLNYFLDKKNIEIYDTLYNLIKQSENRKEIREEKKFIKKYRNSRKNKSSVSNNKIIYSESF